MSSWWDTVWAQMFPARGYESYQQRSARNATDLSGLEYGPWRPAMATIPIVGGLASAAELALFPGTSPSAAKPVRQQSRPSATASPSATTAKGANQDQQAVIDAVSLVLNQGQTGAGLYGNLPVGSVYMGRAARPTSERAEKWNPDRTIPIEAALAEINEWNDKKIARFNELAIGAGYLDKPTNNLDVIEKVWGDLATRSAKMYQRGIKITPWALLNRYSTDPTTGGGAPKTVTQTATSVDLTDPSKARALVNQVLAARLGRDATAEEKKAFLAALNAAEKKNPKTTTTTTTTNAAGTSVNSSSTSSGGLDTAGFADEWAMSHNRDEAGSYQALATYMPMFFQALGAPV